MLHDATNASVTVLPNYTFSFTAEWPKVVFQPNSLGALSTQLGEVRAICDVLFKANVNSLDNLRRERVCADDVAGPGADYVEQHSITNDLAVLTPYEVSFRCFTPELAAVLGGFASSPRAMLVRTVFVAPAPGGAGGTQVAVVQPNQYPNQYPPQYPTQPGENPEQMIGRHRPPTMVVPGVPPPTQPVAPPITFHGLPVVLDESQLEVTLTLDIVKLLPSPAK
jgi:hypothetical protein